MQLATNKIKTVQSFICKLLSHLQVRFSVMEKHGSDDAGKKQEGRPSNRR